MRQLLRDELGTEPGKELQRLHQAILNRDPALSVAGTGTMPAPPIPRELPAEASCFVGREKEEAQLTDALTPSDRGTRRRPPVILLYGPGGVGKSALAVRVAHEVADAYPDGQLYVDLCGSTPGRQPVPPAEVLGRFLRRLGVAPDQIPPDETDASALLRSVSAGRRLLLMLDNAADKDQVTPLLPGSPACGVIVTSRHRLSSLDADQRVRVAVLTDEDGLALLSGLTNGSAADPKAARAIVALSGGLPLAIRIAAGRLASRPDMSASEYVQRLADRSRRLDELELDDLAVRACIRTSYDVLESSDDATERLAAHAFRMLGLLQIPDFAPGVVAAMLSAPTDGQATKAMDRLVDAQLLEPLQGVRYRPHDLVRLVAAEIAAARDGESSRDGAFQRAVSYYSAGSLLAGRLLYPGRSRAFSAPRVPNHLALPAFSGPTQARVWVGAELQSLVAILEQTILTSTDVNHETLWLSEEVWDHLHFRNEWQTARRLSDLALEVGRRRGDDAMAAWGHLALGRAEANLGDYDAATRNLECALRTTLGLKWPAGTALTLTALGVVSSWRGDPSAGLSYYAQAMELAQKHQLRAMRSMLLLNMSSSYLVLGQLSDAMNTAEQCAAVSREEHSLQRLGDALNNLAASYSLSGKPAKAVHYADEALACAREVGNLLTEREVLINRSLAYLWLGDHTAAAQDVQEVLTSRRTESGDYTRAAGLRVRAKILWATRNIAEAREAAAQADAAYAGLRSRRDPVIEMLLAYDASNR
jgi:tetratricopeptide (TPR) repeat protein